MGFITTGASLLSVAGGVAGSVLSLGSGALKLGGKFMKSTVGKLTLGAGVMAVVCSDPKKGGFFGRLKESAGNFFKAIGATVGKAVTTKTAETVATLDHAGDSVNSLTASVAEADTPEAAVQAIADAGAAPPELAGLCAKADMEPEAG